MDSRERQRLGIRSGLIEEGWSRRYQMIVRRNVSHNRKDGMAYVG